jgi:hypothetical protein
MNTPTMQDEMPTSTSIQPVDRVKTLTITGFQVRVLNVELFKSATISVLLMSNNTVVETQVLQLSGDDYAQWTNDDQTLISVVARKLGFTVA